MVDIQGYCGCAYVAINSIERKGLDPLGVPGKLIVESGITIQVNQWVKYNTSSNGWEIIETGDTIGATDKVGVVFRLKDALTDGKEYNAVSVSTEAFESAIIWTAGSGSTHIKAGDTYIWNGSALVAFAPETHTSLAGRLELVPYAGINGEVYYFTFK
jgi:hypothetical protein